jgi:hypothetical protein
MGCLLPIVFWVLAILVLSRVIGGLGPGELFEVLVVAGLWSLVVWTVWFGRVGRR